MLSTYLFGLAVRGLGVPLLAGEIRSPPRWLIGLLAGAAAFTTLDTAWLNGLPILTHLTGYYLSRGS